MCVHIYVCFMCTHNLLRVTRISHCSDGLVRIKIPGITYQVPTKTQLLYKDFEHTLSVILELYSVPGL